MYRENVVLMHLKIEKNSGVYPPKQICLHLSLCLYIYI